MTLKSSIQTKLGAALSDSSKLADIAFDLSYEHPVTEVITTGRGYGLNLNDTETDGESEQVVQAACSILQNELAVEPEIDGIIKVIDTGFEFTVSEVKHSSAGISWRLTGFG